MDTGVCVQALIHSHIAKLDNLVDSHRIRTCSDMNFEP